MFSILPKYVSAKQRNQTIGIKYLEFLIIEFIIFYEIKLFSKSASCITKVKISFTIFLGFKLNYSFKTFGEVKLLRQK
ncbi:hypothetical protein DNC80_15170 [Flavobacterium sp. SOK18b]|nr:hypothetical protein [Flavobacterium sp. SOK18b]